MHEILDRITKGQGELEDMNKLEELAAYADQLGAPDLPGSGRQEYLESVVNQVLFS